MDNKTVDSFLKLLDIIGEKSYGFENLTIYKDGTFTFKNKTYLNKDIIKKIFNYLELSKEVDHFEIVIHGYILDRYYLKCYNKKNEILNWQTHCTQKGIINMAKFYKVKDLKGEVKWVSNIIEVPWTKTKQLDNGQKQFIPFERESNYILLTEEDLTYMPSSDNLKKYKYFAKKDVFDKLFKPFYETRTVVEAQTSKKKGLISQIKIKTELNLFLLP